MVAMITKHQTVNMEIIIKSNFSRCDISMVFLSNQYVPVDALVLCKLMSSVNKTNKYVIPIVFSINPIFIEKWLPKKSGRDIYACYKKTIQKYYTNNSILYITL